MNKIKKELAESTRIRASLANMLWVKDGLPFQMLYDNSSAKLKQQKQ